ncbi:MAG TPA: hypothetical protein VHA56_12645 [Mucilaginibacter sp.]|nr:hypothetical protein [Mucilaginibacter sp.]
MRKKVVLRFVARCLILSLTFQLVYPNVAMALTSGPSQPEVQSFEPVGTTDMVDMFTGDFNYNIPLMDIEGYPINISYHGGVGMEQEASWVGLGWNINPGVVNRTVRGVPDDFKGETLTKELHIKDEKILRLGIEEGGETVGLGDPSIIQLDGSIGSNVNISNYRGVSADFTFSTGVQLFNFISAGVNLGVGSQSGADVDLYGGINIATSQLISKDMGAGVGVNVGTGYNTRTGSKDISFSMSGTLRCNNISASTTLVSGNIPISLKNYVPVITNSNTMTTYYGRVKAGLEAEWCNVWGAIKAKYSKVQYYDDGTRNAYGYMYAEQANTTDIMDFTREKDGMFNKSMQNLPLATMTYDVYSLSGQGTGGSFRAFRNDIASVFDPIVSNSADENSFQAEASFGWIFAIGGDVSGANTRATSGPWMNHFKSFSSDASPGDLYEKVYFKQGGDLAMIDQDYWNEIKKYGIIEDYDFWNIPSKKDGERQRRSTLYSCNKADDVVNSDQTVSAKNIQNYYGKNGFEDGFEDSIATINRVGGSRKGHQVSEIVQTQTDGRRYVYGLPAMNNIQRESIFATNNVGDGNGLVSYTSTDDSKSNTNGIDEYYSSTITPAFTHAYFLTSVLSTDYVDITGDGPSEDDIGSYNKFNYSLKSDDYRWRAPVQTGKAQYNPGFLSDSRDDKASYIVGSREEWILHSIESKNFVAEFYTSKRSDAKGVTEAIKGGGAYNATASSDKQYSYKLDSIKLYSKNDRILHKATAIPIKTVFFEYTDTLCRNVPNADSNGKLTLTKISFRYGNSNKSMVSPYQFNYSSCNPDYNIVNKDRWGNYKPSGGSMSNYEYPYVDQTDTADNTYASAWSLNKITLPSGGVINVDYESDDYSEVQNFAATEMFKIVGVGYTNGFGPGRFLYSGKHSPNSYIYFQRDKNRENPSLNAQANYFGTAEVLYYSFNVRLREKFEQIRGYANVYDVGYANSDYGYVNIGSVDIEGSDAILNPITKTALNIGRYNLPHVLFPGSDPDQSTVDNVLSGLTQAIHEALRIGQNPLVHMLKQGWANEIKPEKSFIRLNSPGHIKKGGGYRVKQLTFYDSWNDMVGGYAQTASYGKVYDYTTKDVSGNTYSSGVASYEPCIGGDENPMRKPIPYIGQNASHFPPNDAVDLYQEGPVGESLFPPPLVGYSKVTVSSIHQSVGRSSQAVDVYQFYTAADYPCSGAGSPINEQDKHKFKLKEQDYSLHATQGYIINLNDMHGRPKSIEHFVRKPTATTATLAKVSYQVYHYSKDNMVNVVNLTDSGVGIRQVLLGVDADVTLDSRLKTESTHTQTVNGNVNVSTALVLPIPVILVYGWNGEYNNEFASSVITKVVQRYPILTEVESYDEGALTVLKNEVFDPLTGQPVITSVNNEFKDKEYSVNYPAYWAYKEMGGAYQNAGYTDAYSSVSVNTSDGAIIPADGRKLNYNVGDEVLMTYDYGSSIGLRVIAYVMGYGSGDCQPLLKPKFLNLSSTYGWDGSHTFTNVSLKILRSGRRNLLTDNIESYTTFDMPIKGGGLQDSLTNVIDIKARSFGDPKVHAVTAADTYINEYSNGRRGMYRVNEEYTYHNNRNYTSPGVRKAGVFFLMSPWRTLSAFNGGCSSDGNDHFDDNKDDDAYRLATYTRSSYFYPNFSGWNIQRKVTMWSPFATEVENFDAAGNNSTAVYGFNQELPVAVAFNAQQGTVLYDGFEDYGVVRVLNNLTNFLYSPFKGYFSEIAVSGSSKYGILNLDNGSSNTKIINGVSHTGNFSFKVGSDNTTISFPITSALSSTLYKPFTLQAGQKYILSYWVKPPTDGGDGSPVSLDNLISTTKSPFIDKWQQIECVFTAKSSGTQSLVLHGNVYIDDIRIYPYAANMKSFAYNSQDEKLMATLDENNYATFYEYDAEGNLVRTKKETEKGIMTISESRSANTKK